MPDFSPSFLAFVHAAPQPCCALVAVWALSSAGLEPTDATSPYAWARLDYAAWCAINVYDDRNRWSGPPAVARLVGGVVDGPRIRVGRKGLDWPTLPIRRWCAVQIWRPNGTGHAYLVCRQPSGLYRVVQSTEKYGYSDAIVRTWCNRGYDVMIAATTIEEEPA